MKCKPASCRTPKRAYCRGPYCVQSDTTVESLTKKGFKAMRLEYGQPEWKARGFAVQTAAA